MSIPIVKLVFLLSAYPIEGENIGVGWLLENSKPLEGFSVTHEPDEADIILFVEGHPGLDPYFFRVINHTLFKKYPQKCILFHDADRSVTLARTITPCIHKNRADPATKAGFHYIARPMENHFINTAKDFDCPRDYLFSFDGASKRNPTRQAIMQLEHPQGLLIDRGGQRIWTFTDKELKEMQRHFAESMLRSHFVLCPAGIGPSSYRLFETMQLARVPVILSDQLVLPEGPDWNEFSITIPERMAHCIPEILEERKSEAREMGITAREVWEDYFSPEVSLQRLCEAADRRVVHPYKSFQKLHDCANFLHKEHSRGLFRYIFRQRKQLKQQLANLTMDAYHPQSTD